MRMVSVDPGSWPTSSCPTADRMAQTTGGTHRLGANAVMAFRLAVGTGGDPRTVVPWTPDGLI